MGFTQLDDWLAWLEQAHPTEIELGLDRVQQVLSRLELPAPNAVITVAGTNGKGSCVTAASALLQAAGWRVGSYTSPHLHHYCERVRINAEAVSEADMCSAFAAIDAARGEVSLTYFEFGTLAALLLFAQHDVDVMVLEVGLGGRLDAVNVVAPDVAVITSIDIDHEAWLGRDRNAIGREKAGIMRPDKVAICVEPDPPPALLQHAAEVGAALRLIGRDFTLAAEPTAASHPWRLTDAADGAVLQLPPLPLVATSVAAAILAVKALGVDVASLPLAELLSTLSLPGRMQNMRFDDTPALIDVAHNPAATAYLAREVAARKPQGRVFALVAMMADKDAVASLQPLMSLVDTWLPVSLVDVPRAAPPESLEAIINDSGGTVLLLGTLAEALAQLRSGQGVQLTGDDLLLVFGSFFTVGAALQLLTATALPVADGEALSD